MRWAVESSVRATRQGVKREMKAKPNHAGELRAVMESGKLVRTKSGTSSSSSSSERPVIGLLGATELGSLGKMTCPSPLGFAGEFECAAPLRATPFARVDMRADYRVGHALAGRERGLRAR